MQANEIDMQAHELASKRHLADELAAKCQLERGIASAEQGDFHGAVQAFERGLALTPRSAEIYHNLGIAYSAGEQFSDAIDAFTQAIALQAEYPEAHYGLADALFRSGNMQESIGQFQAALSLCPPEATEALLTLRYNLGVAFSRVGKESDAAQQWRKAIQVDPGFTGSHSAIAGVLLSRGDVRGAAFYLDIIARLHPDSAPARQEAIAVYTEVLKEERRSPGLISLAAAKSEVDSLLVQAASLETDCAVLLLKLECCQVRCVESRKVTRNNCAKGGAVAGGIMGVLGGPLGIAAGAYIGARIFGGSENGRDEWSPVLDSLSGLKAKLLLG